jgi:transposase
MKADSTTASERDLELLATHLAPRFGNIYDYNPGGGDAGYEVQPWTDDLRDAVRHHLLHELPDEVADYLFTADTVEPRDPASREAQVDAVIDGSQPWEVALAVREAAVSAVPVLDQLIGHLDVWQSEDERLDAATWLDAHADGDRLWKDLAQASDHWELLPVAVTPEYQHDPEPDDLVHVLTPPRLLAAWHRVVGPAPSDLTDAEWALLVPFLPQGGLTKPMTASRLAYARRALNGMLYRYANKTAWTEVPERYGGTGHSLVNRHADYKRRGVFAQALRSLDGNPDARRLTEWLRTIDASALQGPLPDA